MTPLPAWAAPFKPARMFAAEAASAAEQSVRLTPQLPNAHNLLIRIYQMQGRVKEAAEQAEWMRDYERRLKSR